MSFELRRDLDPLTHITTHLIREKLIKKLKKFNSRGFKSGVKVVRQTRILLKLQIVDYGIIAHLDMKVTCF